MNGLKMFFFSLPSTSSTNVHIMHMPRKIRARILRGEERKKVS